MPGHGKERHMSIKEQLQQLGRGKYVSGHGMTAPERYAPDTRHMVIMDIRKDHGESRVENYPKAY